MNSLLCITYVYVFIFVDYCFLLINTKYPTLGGLYTDTALVDQFCLASYVVDWIIRNPDESASGSCHAK